MKRPDFVNASTDEIDLFYRDFVYGSEPEAIKNEEWRYNHETLRKVQKIHGTCAACKWKGHTYKSFYVTCRKNGPPFPEMPEGDSCGQYELDTFLLTGRGIE